MTPSTAVIFTLTPKIGIRKAMTDAGIVVPAAITKLTIIGMLTDNDFKNICKMMGKSLKEIDMSSVENLMIPNNAFKNCDALQFITLPKSVKDIGEMAFPASCFIEIDSDNQHFLVENSVLFSHFNKEKKSLIHYPALLKDNYYVISDTVKEIGASAFKNCTHLNSIIIPDSVEHINEEAFSGCSGLTSITLPNSLKIIRKNAFACCTGLTEIFIPASVTLIERDAFEDCFAHITIDSNNRNYKIENGKIVFKTLI